MSILIFFGVLFVLVVVHEWGHFIAAKKLGIRVDEFGVGFPPKAYGFTPKGSETEYSINWLPIGGFVRIFGEDPNDESIKGPDGARSFVNKPAWVRAVVLVAGVTMNILLAYLLYVVAFSMGILTSTESIDGGHMRDQQVVVYEAFEGAPADVAGLSSGDLIVGIEGVSSDIAITGQAITAHIAQAKDSPVTLLVNSNGERKPITVTPQTGILESNPSEYAIGVSMGDVAIVSYPFYKALLVAGEHTASMFYQIVVGLGSLLFDAIRLDADLSSVSGPVGIVSLVGDASALGIVYLLSFTAFISLNLAVINLLPFPALDGGRLFFLVIEKIKGSAINPKIANTVNAVGFAFLIILMVVVTISDIFKFF